MKRAALAAVLIALASRCVPGRLGVVDVGAIVPPMPLKSTPETAYAYRSPTPTSTGTPPATPRPTPTPVPRPPGEPVPIEDEPPVPDASPILSQEIDSVGGEDGI